MRRKIPPKSQPTPNKKEEEEKVAFMYILNKVILCDYVSVYAPSPVNFSGLLLRQRREF